MSWYLAWRRARGAAATAFHESFGRVAGSIVRRGGVVPGSPERIVALSLQKIGDAVTTEPALRALRARFPKAHLAVAAAASRERGPDMGAVEVFRLMSGLDAVHPVRRGRDIPRGDLVVVFGMWARDAWAARRAGGVTVGYHWRGRGHALDVRVPAPETVMVPAAEARALGARPQHEVWVQLLVRAGLIHEGPVGEPRLVVPELARRDAKALLAERGVPEKFAVLAPWNDQEHFRWPEERWIQLGRGLADQGLGVVVMGGHGKADVAHAARIVKALAESGVRASSFAGLFGIARDAAVMQASSVVVAIDSGPAHIARAVGARTVVLFGPGSPPVWAPPGAVAVQRTEGCHGCRQPRCYQARRECLVDLDVASVAAAAARA